MKTKPRRFYASLTTLCDTQILSDLTPSKKDFLDELNLIPKDLQSIPVRISIYPKGYGTVRPLTKKELL